MNTELYLIRHGETIWNQQRRLQGQMNSALTTHGKKQAELLGKRLLSINIELVYASDLGRTMETARIINEYLKVEQIIPDKRLRERNFGIFHGYNWEEILKRFPGEGKMERESTADYIIPEGESRLSMQQRAVDFLNEIAEKHKGKKILIVTHGGIIGSLIRNVIHLPIEAPRRFLLPNAAINILEQVGETWFLKTMGELIIPDGKDDLDEQG